MRGCSRCLFEDVGASLPLNIKQNCWKRKVSKSIYVIDSPQIYFIILKKLLGLCWTVGLRSKNLDKDESVKQVGCLSVGGLISD